MRKQFFTTTIITLILLTAVSSLQAKIDSVLEVVPTGAAGFVRLLNLNDFSSKVDEIAAMFSPQGAPEGEEAPGDVIAESLAEAFGAEFTSLEDLKNLGISPDSDFSVFWVEPTIDKVSAAIHILDKKAVKNTFEEKSGPVSEADYNGVKLYTFEDGAFTFLDDILVFSKDKAICKKVIDTYKRKNKSIRTDRDYVALKVDEKNDIVGYFALDRIAQAYSEELRAGADKAKKKLGEAQEQVGQPGVSEILNAEMEFGVWLLEQLKSASFTGTIDAGTIKLTKFLLFKGDSKVNKYISHEPASLDLLKSLPKGALLYVGAAYKADDFAKLLADMMNGFAKHASGERLAADDIKEFRGEFEKMMDNFYKHLGDEMAFSMSMSDSVIPDVTIIYDIKNEKQAKAYMDKGHIEYFDSLSKLYQNMGMPEMFADAKPGPVEKYQDVQIKSIQLPNFSKIFEQMPDEAQMLMPTEWNVWYAFKDKKLIYVMAGTSQPVKNVIDAMDGKVDGFSIMEESITKAFNAQNNFIVYLSPITAIKSALTAMSQVEPQIGMALMMFQNLPETYSVGIAGRNHNKGTEISLFVNLNDIKDLIVMIQMMSGGGM